MKNLTKKQYIEDVSKLVSFRTLTSDLNENKQAIAFIESRISKKAFIKHVSQGGKDILVASTRDTKRPDVCFLVHVDIVAGRPDQFSMKMKKNIAYGRGASDMKFSIPIGYSLLNEFIEMKSGLSFSFVVTTDEETGGFQGAAYLAKQYKFRPKLLIVPDGGDNFVFIDKAKGVCALRIDSAGIPAHSSRIWDGKNALEPLIKLCAEVLKRYEKNNKEESMRTTVNIGIMQGGISANQVCPEAFVILDFRFSETETFQAIFDEVSSLARKIDPAMKVSVYSSGASTAVDRKNPAVKLFIGEMEKIIGRKIEIRPTYGASDARHFTEFDIPVLMMKPNGGDIHGDDENVDIDSCLAFYDGMSNFLKKLEQNPNLLSWHR